VLPDAPAVPADQVFLELPGAQAAESVVTRDIDTISIDFPDEDVRTIIRNVAELYELNVVIPDTLVGSISIKLRNVTWRQVFNVILEPLNFTFIEDANIIKIRSRDELAAEPVDTRVFIINFAKAEEISKSIGPLIDTTIGGRIQVDTRSNALVITERPSRMGGIQEIIDVLDRPTEQVMIESKFVEVTGRDERSLGLDWASLAEFSVGAGPFGRSYSDTQGRTRDIGIDTSDNLSITTTDSGRTSQFSTSDLATSNTLWTGDLVRTDTAVFSMDAFNLVLSALERNNEVQLISNPTVVTVNNTPATINIGEEFPIPNYTYNPERGTFEVAGFEYKPIGINLNVTPQINSAGFINLIIKPEISSRTGEVTFGGAAGAVIPIITTRKTESTVTIKSGYTLAIGGLIEKTSGNRESKVPLLGDIPLLGRAFRSETKSTDQRNLIVFITAKILSASGATYRDVFSQRTLHEMGIKGRDLPGYEPPESERELFDALQQSRDQLERIQTEMRLRQQLQQLQQTQQKESDRGQKPTQSGTIRRRFQ
jgi:type IV pilus assembly protein PilQ